ncbi:MAG: malate synthase A [Myxococcales bacterium]|nr:malate synthase A [Myxococcales bacterium]
MNNLVETSPNVMIAPRTDIGAEILTPAALEFVVMLVEQFAPAVSALLETRQLRQKRFDNGELPQFLPETRVIRESDWRVAPIPADLIDRRVEITGPVDRKMIINALNSGANVFMADFEDSNSPTWDNVVLGQVHLRDAVRGTIGFTDPQSGKVYSLGPKPATLMVRPRGWHLVESHMQVRGKPVPGALFDFGLFFYHNATELLSRGSRPYFYLPKLQSHREAALWNSVFVKAQAALGIALGTIRATVLIETLPAAFEMDEILYELKDHSLGLNCGRWDYIFSYIKTLRNDPERVLPDRGQVTMTQHFLRSYTSLLIRTCHRRGTFAMGGMAAQIPIRNDPEKNAAAMAKVREDKLREVLDGHDGTWVAHPGLVALAREIFDQHMQTPNQIDKLRLDVAVDATDLVSPPTGFRTEAGLRHNIRVGVQYLEAWLRGSGCVPIYNLMEDAATAEISRTQVWQWLHHRTFLDGDKELTPAWFYEVLDQEMDAIRNEVGDEAYAAGRFAEAKKLFSQLSTEKNYTEFLTVVAYNQLLDHESKVGTEQ